MNRTELANLIAAAVNASEDYSAKLWAKGGYVRVYVSTCGKDVGYFKAECLRTIQIFKEGTK